MRIILISMLLSASLAVAACGGDDSSSESATSPARARTEAAATRKALSQALATYRGGDAKAAEDQVAEAYLQHFELVEGPLEEKDAELTEELEEAISGDLRSAMKARKPAGQIESRVRSVLDDLEKAEAALR
jgi:hypothetical protein